MNVILALLISTASLPQDTVRPNITILTTGGTIASRTDAPTLEGPVLVQAVPELLEHAAVTVREVVRIGSSQMTPAIWWQLAGSVTDALEQGAAGVVITHGTDTMEETAYFLSLTVPTDKPIVVTGSMRSANTISADGPANLLQAVRTAASPDAGARGVLVVLNDVIHGARDVRKTDNQRVQTFESPTAGPLGVVDPDTVLFFHPAGTPIRAPAFEISAADSPPTVAILQDYAGFDGGTMTHLLHRGARGVVIETFAGGRMSAGARSASQQAIEASLPVVIASRVPEGRISGNPIVPGTVLARDLSAHKARVLLIVALAAGTPTDRLQDVFDRY